MVTLRAEMRAKEWQHKLMSFFSLAAELKRMPGAVIAVEISESEQEIQKLQSLLQMIGVHTTTYRNCDDS